MDDEASLRDRDAALTTVALRLRDADGLAGAVDGRKLEEGAGLAADQVELLDGAEALLERGAEDRDRQRVDDALDEALAGRDRGCSVSANRLRTRTDPG